MTRKRTPPRQGRVTVEVAEPHAVYLRGEQRTGTVEDVPVELALTWLRHGWITYAAGDALDGKGAPA
ncbi:hypothetical protein [Mycolicibacterium litorale]|uniref:Uncharacterized protein n=1 Tax=Mycolicibacterium litorale TaxID=758802 RepID=A0AAD1MR28_9MYCO|nr:hypothetical protein [Mycolicibacterium litorale]MCV7418815.1 hypothetical protein [Mycolicibacterium litorale]TDY00403.1 hypothetical protein BCL50_5260 [Mycolicibacterium litorale]BBY15764.1 hypothetical protein MLIT_13560 [Mycolicibacterium litorale]